MKNIVTIWWGNWQSSILKLMYEHLLDNKLFDEINISSIVSMSDDGRTTWVLINIMREWLGLYMPPPWDLRRCLFALSDSIYRKDFEDLFEKVITLEKNISDYSLWEIISLTLEEWEFFSYLKEELTDFLDSRLLLNYPIKWHKFGNILMALLFVEKWDYSLMLELLSKILKVKWQVLPVTTQKAFIQAHLQNWEIIQTQDQISNVVDYSSNIEYIELMQNSKDASVNKNIEDVIKKADYIIITPGDLYTSIDTNFVINWFNDLINKSKVKKIYVLNQCSKNWETTDFNVMNFIDFINSRLENKLDYIFANNKKPELTLDKLSEFKNDISVKWWDYLYIDENIKKEISSKYPNLRIISWDYLDTNTLYKYNKSVINDLFDLILTNV